MAKMHLFSLEATRGIAMLGVVGIHTGAFSLSYAQPDIHLFALLEIASRFSVPIFFFISAFGLFLNDDLEQPFQYGRFLIRRLRTVLIPYLTWSLLYMTHYTYTSGDEHIWDDPFLQSYFLFGLGSYQLYFLVILLWFYLFMPLWRPLVRQLSGKRIWLLPCLFFLQMAFNYWSYALFRPHEEDYWLNLLLQYRLSYWPWHYVFLFLLGGVCAVRVSQFRKLLQRYFSSLSFAALASLGLLLGYYYILVLQLSYSLEDAVNAAQQLSPPGMLYTLGATFWLFALFDRPLPGSLSWLLSLLGRHSYFVYLVHPFFMYYAMEWLTDASLELTPERIPLFFLWAAGGSLCAAIAFRFLSRFIPGLSWILTGSGSRR